ncbi:MAG: hypothetical protein NC489_45885 [Ruminococcus flavefaciens]|nr:hypothetical protein [Ruminococcus flavefaciens]
MLLIVCDFKPERWGDCSKDLDSKSNVPTDVPSPRDDASAAPVRLSDISIL